MTIARGRPEPTPSTPDITDGEGRRQGLWTDADAHGGVMIGDYVDGVRQGEWRHYSADGRLRSRGHYDDGQLDGEWTWYRANGRVMQTGGFRRGSKHGIWERWNDAGEPLDRGRYDDGRKAGTWETFHPDGSVRKTTEHRSRRT